MLSAPALLINLLAQKNQTGYFQLREKRTPHCKLSVVKGLVEAGKVWTTHSARVGATELGLTLSGMLEVGMSGIKFFILAIVTGNAKTKDLTPTFNPDRFRSAVGSVQQGLSAATISRGLNLAGEGGR